MPYREARCAFCDLVSETTCSRCYCAACAEHGPGPASWCAACETEWSHDVDVAGFDLTVREIELPDGLQARETFLEFLKRAIDRIRKRRAKSAALRAFIARTPSEIAHWRRTNGVTVRVR